MRNIDFKKIILIMLGLIVLFVPTYIAIANYYSQKPIDVVDSVTTITIRDPEGRTHSISSDNDENNIIKMFDNINKSGTPVSSLPDTLAGNEFLLVTYSTNDSELSYKYYFTIDSNECYFSDFEGKNYKIAIQQAKEFLGSTFSIYLYKTATPPVLTASEVNTISASDLKWFYLVSGGTYQQYNYTPENNEVLTYDIGSSFEFNFSIEPSYANVQVYNGATLLYDDTIKNINTALQDLQIKRHTTLEFIISATWEQTAECEYYGSATYSFSSLIKAPAEFKLGENVIEYGDVVVISGVNVDNPSEIEVTFEPALPNNFKPEFFTDGALVHALVPFSYDIYEKATDEDVIDNYKITVSYGITKQTLELNVNKARHDFKRKASSYNASTELIELYYSEEDIAAYEALYSEICSSTEDLRYFSEEFIDYRNANTITAKGASLELGFSREKILADGRHFIHDGIDFEVASGVDVPAMNSGKIVYKGNCDVLGNFVVIDHGYGLKTWYAHLSEISVSVGDVVTKSQIIGKTGNTGFTLEKRLHVQFTVQNIPIAPFSIWEEGIILPTFD